MARPMTYGGLKIYTTIETSRINANARKKPWNDHIEIFIKSFPTMRWEKRDPWWIGDNRIIENFIEDAVRRTEAYRLLKN